MKRMGRDCAKTLGIQGFGFGAAAVGCWWWGLPVLFRVNV